MLPKWRNFPTSSPTDWCRNFVTVEMPERDRIVRNYLFEAWVATGQADVRVFPDRNFLSNRFLPVPFNQIFDVLERAHLDSCPKKD